MQKIIEGKGICFSYGYPNIRKMALDCVDFSVNKGEFVSIVGQNGSGKSTLVKLLNGLLPLETGTLFVDGIDLSSKDDIWKLRRKVGMVFQNPDNQFVSSIIKEDIAFGLENYGINRDEINKKIKESLDIVGMLGYEDRSPHSLSGGQKQRIALAGVLALEPDIIIFDEATSMLDEQGRKDILQIIDALKKQGKTIIMVSHYIDETLNCDMVCVMDNGKIMSYGNTYDILTDNILMEKAGLSLPFYVRLYYDLKKMGIDLKQCPLTEEDFKRILECL